ncbi:hypothetical protein EON65_37680 [archaeon]|nr:MAG: hypothetical protein EON65_37680 [archaeon]
MLSIFTFYHNSSPQPQAMEGASYPLIPPAELMVPDSRAHKLLITYVQGWHLVPFPEVFSRHSGTCVIVGDRSTPSLSYSIKVGFVFLYFYSHKHTYTQTRIHTHIHIHAIHTYTNTFYIHTGG